MFNQKQVQKPYAAIMYDFDDVLNNPRGANPSPESTYIVDEHGNMGGSLIGQEKLKRIVQLCVENHIALYIITARPERAWQIDFITKHIQDVGGFHEGAGGFKPHHMHCLGLEKYSQELGRLHVESLIKDKLACIQGIHQTELNHLPKNRILFIDDDLRNLEPAEKAGYTTIRAHIGNDTHHDQTLNFIDALLHLPMTTTLGNYAVLVRPDQFDIHPRATLNRNEFFEQDRELNGWYWRKQSTPNFNALAEEALNQPQQRQITASRLNQLGFEQAIFFRNDISLISDQVMHHCYGTLQSIKDLAHKKLIILVGSQGKRKIAPLTQALERIHPTLFKDTAVIGLPAESGVACQPVGHQEIFSGCKHRLNQVLCFKQGLDLLLDTLPRNKSQRILSIAIENGIGLFPVDSEPLTSLSDKKQFHFYDQAHILYDFDGETKHKVAKPSRIDYVLTGAALPELEAYFENGQPTQNYYHKQSEWSWEMLSRLDSERPERAYPYRYEHDGRVLSSNDLIQEVLENVFSSTLNTLEAPRKDCSLFKNSSGTESKQEADQATKDPVLG